MMKVVTVEMIPMKTLILEIVTKLEEGTENILDAKYINGVTE